MMATIEALDLWLYKVGLWVDLIALLLILAIAYVHRKKAVAWVVAGDFVLTYLSYAGIYSALSTFNAWGPYSLDYFYGLGVKDAVVILSLVAINHWVHRVNPVLILAYGIGCVLTWSVWATYLLIYSQTWLEWTVQPEVLAIMDSEAREAYIQANHRPFFVAVYYLWSPLYFLVMWMEVTAFGWAGTDMGSPTRKRNVSRISRSMCSVRADNPFSYNSHPRSRMG